MEQSQSQSQSTKYCNTPITPVSSYLCEIGTSSCEGDYGQDCRCLYCFLTPITIIYDTLSFLPRLCYKKLF